MHIAFMIVLYFCTKYFLHKEYASINVAREVISDHQISKKFLEGGGIPQTPLELVCLRTRPMLGPTTSSYLAPGLKHKYLP